MECRRVLMASELRIRTNLEAPHSQKLPAAFVLLSAGSAFGRRDLCTADPSGPIRIVGTYGLVVELTRHPD